MTRRPSLAPLPQLDVLQYQAAQAGKAKAAAEAQFSRLRKQASAAGLAKQQARGLCCCVPGARLPPGGKLAGVPCRLHTRVCTASACSLQGSAAVERLKAEAETAKEETAEMRRVRLPVPLHAALQAGVTMHPQPPPHRSSKSFQANYELQEQVERLRHASADSAAALAAAQAHVRRLEVGLGSPTRALCAVPQRSMRVARRRTAPSCLAGAAVPQAGAKEHQASIAELEARLRELSGSPTGRKK